MRTKFRLTTMEEDFTAFGLIYESKPTRKETNEGSTEVDEDMDEEDEDEDEEDEGEVVEALKLRRRPKKSAAIRKALARARKKYYKTHKGQELKRSRKYAKSARGKKRSKMRSAFWSKHSGMKGKKGFRLGAGLDRVANMVEEVAGIIDTIGERQDLEFVKGFANVALIADTIGRGFSAIGHEIEEDELVSLGASFAELAEDAATVAEGLDSGELDIDEEVEEAFKANMDDLLNGLELYADLTEAQEEEEDEDEESVVDEDEDSDSEDSDDEEDPEGN